MIDLGKIYDELAKEYDRNLETGKIRGQSLKVLGEAEKNSLLGLANPRKNDCALDVACRTGRITIELAKVCGGVCGVDISINMLKICRDKSRQYGSVVETKKADARRCPI